MPALLWSQFSGVRVGHPLLHLQFEASLGYSRSVSQSTIEWSWEGMEDWLDLSLGFLWDFHSYLKTKAVLGHIWISPSLQERATVGGVWNKFDSSDSESAFLRWGDGKPRPSCSPSSREEPSDSPALRAEAFLGSCWEIDTLCFEVAGGNSVDLNHLT